YKLISYFSDYLPSEILELYDHQLAKFTVTEFDEADSDDTGETMFDENGNVHYPVSLNSAFKRHRKYNWDLVFGTPDINDISKIIRGACEWAFHHRNRDSFIFTKRNPLVSQHKPMNNGLTVDKHFKKGAKVPLWVHLVYK
ncbi:zonular occludens toxin domain-containing protein, partial [Onishia taeanensis]